MTAEFTPHDLHQAAILDPEIGEKLVHLDIELDTDPDRLACIKSHLISRMRAGLPIPNVYLPEEEELALTHCLLVGWVPQDN